MALTQIVVLAILQGVTLVLPVGTACHMALLQAFTDWPAPSPQLNLAFHSGAMLAAAIYFCQDLWDMATGVARAAKGKRDPGARLALQLFIASTLAVGASFAADRYLDSDWQSMAITGWTTLGFGMLLFVFDRMSMTVKRVEHATIGDAVVVGISQVLALVPGAGRSASSMTFARFLGYERAEAARLSLLLSIPFLLSIIGIAAYRLFREGALQFVTTDIIGGAATFVVSLITIAILMGYLKRSSFMPFAIYRLLVGAVILVLAYGVIAI